MGLVSLVQLRIGIGPRLLFLGVFLAACCCCYVGAQGGWHCSQPVFIMLQSMCGSCYAGHDKRSDSSLDRTPQQSLDAFIEKEIAYSFIKRTTSGNTFLRNSRTQHRGLIDECCTQQCEPGEMVLYCCQERQREWHTVRGLFKK